MRFFNSVYDHVSERGDGDAADDTRARASCSAWLRTIAIASTIRRAVELVNRGTTSSFAPGVAFNSSGTIQVQSGTLTASGGGSFDGTTTIEQDILRLVNGGFTAASGALVTGTGTLELAGAVLTLAERAEATVANLGISSGTATIDGTGAAQKEHGGGHDGNS